LKRKNNLLNQIAILNNYYINNRVSVLSEVFHGVDLMDFVLAVGYYYSQ